MGVTIKDIARMANVSHTTVSRALNNSPFINEKTKQKIMYIVNELNYVPNYSAKSLVLNRSYNIGLFFSTIHKGTSPDFFYETINGVNSIVSQSYNLVIKGIDDCKDLSYITKERFDGIILISQSESDNLFIYEVINKNIPLVVLNREIEADNVINILSAEKDGAYEAVNYLIHNGHNDIAIIEGAQNFKSTSFRKEGYINALINSGIKINNDYIVQGEYNVDSGYEAMKKLLSLSKIPTAVFCSNDDMAVGALKAVKKSGLKVPQDISIIGFDDNIFCDYVFPPLTTVRKLSNKIAVVGSQRLLGLIKNPNTSGQKVYIKTELIIRESVKKIN
ncbi:LacI family DNA-binding transcriptional regulator [Clostridium arbusti]|uniref:LacI family DNA-binding transcriptional regulator n=1 Tax=Clostridium arbusti TaxID=1137848 RepID=UPI000287C14B|nr:LacI family DNA-binding transcriptional regulator [Clostridium arbusti]